MHLSGRSVATLPELQQAQELYAAANRQVGMTRKQLLLSDTTSKLHHCRCRIKSLSGLCCAAGLLLADLSWNDIEQVPQGLPATLVSLNLAHNRLADLPATLSALALLPNLRILHLKVLLADAFTTATHRTHLCSRILSRAGTSNQPTA